MEERHPSSDPHHGQDNCNAGYDNEEEERDLRHQGTMHMDRGGRQT